MVIRSVVSLAVALGWPSLVLAQSVPGTRLYGSIDLALAATHSGAPGAGTSLSVTSGVLRPSVFGMEGNEALDAGRDYTPLYWAAMDGDVQGLKLYGNLQQSLA